MPGYRALLVVTIAATALPVLPAYPAGTTAPAAQPESTANLQLQVPAAPAQPQAAPALRAASRPSGLRLESDASPYASLSRHDNHHYGVASGVSTGALKLAPPAAARPGWQFSGRAGPVRWLTPLDGEGETKLRFGGRVPGQPRLPGLGLFNLSVHYSFE